MYLSPYPSALNRQIAADAALMRRSDPVRIGKVVEKPASVRARMLRAVTDMAMAGEVSTGGLKRLGYSDAEINAHAADVLRQVLVAHPTLATVQLGA